MKYEPLNHYCDCRKGIAVPEGNGWRLANIFEECILEEGKLDDMALVIGAPVGARPAIRADLAAEALEDLVSGIPTNRVPERSMVFPAAYHGVSSAKNGTVIVYYPAVEIAENKKILFWQLLEKVNYNIGEPASAASNGLRFDDIDAEGVMYYFGVRSDVPEIQNELVRILVATIVAKATRGVTFSGKAFNQLVRTTIRFGHPARVAHDDDKTKWAGRFYFKNASYLWTAIKFDDVYRVFGMKESSDRRFKVHKDDEFDETSFMFSLSRLERYGMRDAKSIGELGRAMKKYFVNSGE